MDAAARSMAAGGRRRRPLRYQSLAALVEDSQWPFLFLVSDFSYGADDYDGEGNEEQKGPPEGSETMPYIDESPTMSPQFSARSQGGGDSISPTPPEGLAPGVGTPAFPFWVWEEGTLGEGLPGRHGCHGPGSAWDTAGGVGLGKFGSGCFWGPCLFPVLDPLRLGSPLPHLLLSLPPLPAVCSPCLLDTLTSSLSLRALGRKLALLSGPRLDSGCVCGLWAGNLQMPAQQTKASGAHCGAERAASVAFPEDQGPPASPPLEGNEP